MGSPKTGTRDGQTIHYSVGVLVESADQVLLIDRNNEPPGHAGLAGHQDDDEEPAEAVVREVHEESGLVLVSYRQLLEEFVPWNWCGRGITGHYWHLFSGQVEGTPRPSPREVKSIAWHPKTEIDRLTLEPVWRYWFEKLGYIKSA